MKGSVVKIKVWVDFIGVVGWGWFFSVVLKQRDQSFYSSKVQLLDMGCFLDGCYFRYSSFFRLGLIFGEGYI